MGIFGFGNDAPTTENLFDSPGLQTIFSVYASDENKARSMIESAWNENEDFRNWCIVNGTNKANFIEVTTDPATVTLDQITNYSNSLPYLPQISPLVGISEAAFLVFVYVDLTIIIEMPFDREYSPEETYFRMSGGFDSPWRAATRLLADIQRVTIDNEANVYSDDVFSFEDVYQAMF